MPLLKFLSQALNIIESDIYIIGHADEQREVMSSYLLARRDGANVTGVPVGVDGSIVTINLEGYNYAGEGKWLLAEDYTGFDGFEGEFEAADDSEEYDQYQDRDV